MTFRQIAFTSFALASLALAGCSGGDKVATNDSTKPAVSTEPKTDGKTPEKGAETKPAEPNKTEPTKTEVKTTEKPTTPETKPADVAKPPVDPKNEKPKVSRAFHPEPASGDASKFSGDYVMVSDINKEMAKHNKSAFVGKLTIGKDGSFNMTFGTTKNTMYSKGTVQVYGDSIRLVPSEGKALGFHNLYLKKDDKGLAATNIDPKTGKPEGRQLKLRFNKS